MPQTKVQCTNEQNEQQHVKIVRHLAIVTFCHCFMDMHHNTSVRSFMSMISLLDERCVRLASTALWNYQSKLNCLQPSLRVCCSTHMESTTRWRRFCQLSNDFSGIFKTYPEIILLTFWISGPCRRCATYYLKINDWLIDTVGFGMQVTETSSCQDSAMSTFSLMQSQSTNVYRQMDRWKHDTCS